MARRSVSHLKKSAKQNETEISSVKSVIDYLKVTFPEVSGRSLVRETCLSKLRSAISLITQPAERIKKTPSIKIKKTFSEGFPLDATQIPQSVGHINKRLPIGFSTRINCR